MKHIILPARPGRRFQQHVFDGDGTLICECVTPLQAADVIHALNTHDEPVNIVESFAALAVGNLDQTSPLMIQTNAILDTERTSRR